VIAVGFVGHLDDPVLLSSVVLANSLYNVTGYSIVSGLSAGMETLCGQVRHPADPWHLVDLPAAVAGPSASSGLHHNTVHSSSFEISSSLVQPPKARHLCWAGVC
jgi:hypothetical protein